MICNDIRNNIELAGLVQTDDPGQLNIDSVTTLPADRTFAGYHVFRFNDLLQSSSPIFIKLEYGCDREGLGSHGSYGRGRTLRIKVQVSTTKDWEDSETVEFQCPQTYTYSSNSISTQLTQEGWSAICYNEDRGFFGIAYGVGSRNKPFAHSYGNYYGSTLCFFVQRTHNAYGVPDDEGFLVHYPDLGSGMNTSNLWESGNITTSKTCYISSSKGKFDGTSQFSNRLDNDTYPYLKGRPSFMPLFTLADDRFVSMSTIAQGFEYAPGEQVEFTMETIPGRPENFIALGNQTSLAPSPNLRQRSAIAMLFE